MQTRAQIQELQKAELESMAGLAEAVLHGVEQVARLNLQMLRDATHEGADAMRAAVSARDLPEWIRVQSGNPAQANAQKALDYARQWAELAGTTQAELTEAMNRGVSRVQQALREAVAGDDGSRATARADAGSSPRLLGRHGSNPLADSWGQSPAASLFQQCMQITAQALQAMQASPIKAARNMADNAHHATPAVVKHAAAQHRHVRGPAA